MQLLYSWNINFAAVMVVDEGNGAEYEHGGVR